MVDDHKGNQSSSANTKRSAETIPIKSSTPHEYIDELFTPFGGFLLVVKMLAAFQFESLFDSVFVKPQRDPKRGHFFMLNALIFLLVVGFQRLFHFSYIAQDPMLLGALAIERLPAISTFWRWLRSCGTPQADSLLHLMALLRQRVWWQVGYAFKTVHVDIDTTVETVYGDIEGARKGYNPKHRGKKGLRPVLSFIAETKEYFTGKLRQGATISGEELCNFLKSLRPLLPKSAEKVIIRADSEFYSQDAVSTCEEENYSFIISVKKTVPPFDPDSWYSFPDDPDIQYNSCLYKPKTWRKAYRFVVMRIRKTEAEKKNPQQTELFADAEFKYRIFVTDVVGEAHLLIEEYDGRASAELSTGFG